MLLKKHSLKEHRCKFKINKLTYSKSQCRAAYYFAKKDCSKVLRVFFEKWPSRNTTEFTYCPRKIIANTNFDIFSHFATSISHLSINCTTLESSFSQLVFEKNLLFFFFCRPCQRNNRAQVYRLNLQAQSKKLFPRKYLIDKAIQFSRSFMM